MIGQLADDRQEREAHDPLDLQLDRLRVTDTQVDVAKGGWSSGVHVSVLLLVGVALGRHGLGVLGDSTLSLLDPVIPVALAALGVLAAFEIGTMPWIGSRMYAAASVQALIAAAVVTVGTLAFARLTADSADASALPLAIALGFCASTSAALGIGSAATRSNVERAIDLDALVPILAGGLAFAAMRQPALLPALSITGHMIGIALTVAVVGWLLLARTGSDTEQRVFGAATLLLLGGVADYLSVSPLMAGLVAGAFWHTTGGIPRESLRRDLVHLQHPFVALILLVAGARTEFTPDIVGLAIIYVLLRGGGKLLGSIACKAVDPSLSRGIAAALLSPGILGVAFALTLMRAAAPEINMVLSVAVLGTIGSQLVAGLKPADDNA